MSPSGVRGEEVEVLFLGEVGKGIESVPESIAEVVHVQVVVVDFLAVVKENAQSVFLLLNQLENYLDRAIRFGVEFFPFMEEGLKVHV